MKKPILALIAAGTLSIAAPAFAQATVECVSHSYNYHECAAGPLRGPALIHQISNASCIMNRTWGYNPNSGYIWVSAGCSGVFADAKGYHHGKTNTADAGARHYNSTGHDTGAALGALLGAAVIDAVIDSGSKHHSSNRHHSPSAYDGCHGIGCYVDNPG